MACAQLMRLLNPRISIRCGCNHVYSDSWIEVPCGWCLNCRLDRQNWLSDAMSYEFKKYNYIGSFVTFTYDDNHITPLINLPQDSFYYYKNDDDEIKFEPFINYHPLEYSLNKNDPKNFLKRLRSKIDYFYKTNKIKSVDLCRRDFRYFMSAEYGDSFGRPHYHFVFFGLDWNFCQQLFLDSWQNGFIDCKPIQAGCFEYITKYLIKQCHGDQAKALYDDNNLVRPYSSHSLGLGKGIILDNLDFIKSHHGCYLSDNNKLRPIPIYYKNWLHIVFVRDNSKVIAQMKQACISPDNTDSMLKQPYSFKKINEFRKKQAQLRHKKLEIACENKGTPYRPLDKVFNRSYDSSLLDVAFDYAKYGDVVPF